MKSEIEQAMQRTRQYLHVDGFFEISFALFCLVLGLYFLAQANLNKGTLLYQVLDTGFVIIVVGAGLLVSWLINAAKQRLTYPRTGYISYPRPPYYRSWTLAGVSMVVAALLVLFLNRAPKGLAWMPAFTGVVVAAAWLWIGFRMNLLRFYLLGIVSLLAGAALAFSGLESLLALSIYYLGMSAVLLASGGLTLLSYLRQTEAAAG